MSSNEEQETSSDNVAKKGIKRMDTIVTGVILGWLIASIYGISKLREKDNASSHEIETNLIPPPKEIERKSFWKRIFGRK
jgi:hypothetical protein